MCYYFDWWCKDTKKNAACHATAFFLFSEMFKSVLSHSYLFISVSICSNQSVPEAFPLLATTSLLWFVVQKVNTKIGIAIILKVETTLEG